MSDIELVVGYATLKAANKELERTGKVAKNTSATFSQAFGQVSTWQQKFQTEQGRVNASLNNHYTASQRANKSAKESASVFANEAKELERLNNKFVAGHRAMDLYSKELNDLAMAHSKGIISAEQQSLAIESLNRDMAAGIGVFSGMGDAAGNTRNKMNSTGMAVQQLGYQMGDFAVQVQSGQSAFVAFSQQATQLVGILPMVASQLGLTMKMAIGLSAGLGIAIPVGTALAGVLYRMWDSGKEAEEAQKTLKESLDSTLESLRASKLAWEELRQGIFTGQTAFVTNLADAAQDLREAQANLEATKAELTGIGAAGGIDIVGLFSKDPMIKAQEDLNAAQEKYNEFLRLSVVESEQFAQNTANSIRDRLTLLRVEQEFGSGSLELRRATFLQEVASFEAAQEKEGVNTALIQQMVDMLKAEEDLKLEMIATQEATEDFLEALLSVDFSSAISGAETLANKMASAAGSAWEILKANAQRIEAGRRLPLDNLAAQYASYGAGRKSFDEEASSKRYSADSTYDGFTTPIVKTRSGSGSRKSSTSQNTLQELEAEIKLRDKLTATMGVEGEQLRMVEQLKKSLGDAAREYSSESLRATAKRIIGLQQEYEKLEEARDKHQSLADSLTSAYGTFWDNMFDSNKSFKESFKDMAKNMIKQLYEVLVVQKMIGKFDASTGVSTGIAGFFGNLTGGLFADGAAFNSGSVTPFAAGGVVSSATMFPMSGGKTGVMGEAGPEAIMPLSRGPDGSLGVKATGASGGTTVYQIEINAQGAQMGVAEQIEVAFAQKIPAIIGGSVSAAKKDSRKSKGGWS